MIADFGHKMVRAIRSDLHERTPARSISAHSEHSA
jgi:hypothetical protein